ncbi:MULTISPECIES: TerC family protein [Kribbella]|uniref:Tellurite resistance protein TerC n=1 Tax=Kribbella pratensis TaxID=2512112 RepID=A0ABY2FMI0_9ACTN|nr:MULTISPECIES: TerC family protein [Kribbella]TDW93820.1 tellurite resistance protein TerC [Kribbella pratensis]TDX02429.1 tellurite resistance protein TerC [Kribbella sp. VKM Ac-2566]
MHVADYVWYITVGLLLALLAFDVFVIGRRPHEPSTRESATAIAFYVGLAVVFGLGVWWFSGGQYAGEFFAGWLTEYSLSVDNLFIFLIIMSRFGVPRKYQQTALLVGIILALVFRGIFIAVGAAAINQFSWVFYIFGAFLVYTAIHLAKQGENDDEDFKENAVIRFAKRRLNATDEYNGVKLTLKKNGRRFVTPMAIVIIALGTTDLLFALDSIPAIYGLTQEPFLVFAANVFALMGLRQLYFLLGDLLRRLVYLSLGLSVVLAFIGVKLVLHAMHVNELPFINGGHHIDWAPEIPIWFSLGFIIVTLGITTILSLHKSRTMQAEEPADKVEPSEPELHHKES